ncbi:hypothetical protein K8R33_03015 [archaeon]|nr:hypothetical protein [archaeon]
MNQRQSSLLVLLLVVGLLVSSCTIDSIPAGADDSSTEALDSELADLEEFEKEIGELEDLNLDDLDF